jgi:hypothetical protein
MDELKIYEVKVERIDIEPFLDELRDILKKDKYEETVHLHEPKQSEEIFEFTRKEKILSVEIDRRSLNRTIFRISSSDVDPHNIIIKVLSRLCADLIATFIRPVAGRVSKKDLNDHLKKHLEELITRHKKG